MPLPDRPMSSTSQDPVLIRDRTTVLASAILLLVAAAAWVFVVLSSVHGEDMAMAMPLSISGGLVFTVCWAVMMTAMMLPSALPVYFAHTLVAGLAGSTLAYAIAVILVVAGAYQLWPLKQVCVRARRRRL